MGGETYTFEVHICSKTSDIFGIHCGGILLRGDLAQQWGYLWLIMIMMMTIILNMNKLGYFTVVGAGGLSATFTSNTIFKVPFGLRVVHLYSVTSSSDRMVSNNEERRRSSLVKICEMLKMLL